MPKHFPSWRWQVPSLLMIFLLALSARHVLSGHQEEYRPIAPDKPFVVPQKVAAVPATAPSPKRPPRASSVSLLLSLMAEDPTIVRGRMGMFVLGQPTVYNDLNVRGGIVTTKTLPVAPAIHVPFAPLATGDYYNPDAEAEYFVKQWLQIRADGYRAEIAVLVHKAELRLLGMIARIKGRSVPQPQSDLLAMEALTAYLSSHLEVSRAGTRLAELAAFDALSALKGKSIVLSGNEYRADTSHTKVDVRRAAEPGVD